MDGKGRVARNVEQEEGREGEREGKRWIEGWKDGRETVEIGKGCEGMRTQ